MLEGYGQYEPECKKDMKIISFNINGLRARLHQLQATIEKHDPDIIGLQEIKVHDEAFPIEDIKRMGYHAYSFGQKAHYGVALLSKKPARYMAKGLPTDTQRQQSRIIVGTFENKGKKLTVLNGYFPQGGNINHETKFPYKRQFYLDLSSYLSRFHSNTEDLIVMGDINISPLEIDIGIGEKGRERWLKAGKCSFQTEERAWLSNLMNWGLLDTYRIINPLTVGRYSWFDYRSHGFKRNEGLRIDVILATPPLAERCMASDIDYELRDLDKPSDHAPVWSTFDYK